MAKEIRNYKVEYEGGSMHGAVRYYKSLSTAKRVARSYVTRNNNYPEHVGFSISIVYTDYTKEEIIYE